MRSYLHIPQRKSTDKIGIQSTDNVLLKMQTAVQRAK